MGSAVFRVRSGQQVVAQYNPIVKNPNTSGQQAQRAKFKLMSQLAAIMAKGMGSFIIKTKAEKGKPSQRNMFTQANFPLVEVSTDDQVTTAKIPMEQLKLTSSSRYFGTVVASASEGFISVGITSNDTTIKAARVVIVGYQTIDNQKTPIIVSQVQSPFVDSVVIGGTVHEAVAEITVPSSMSEFTVLAYGLIPSDSAVASIDLDNIHTPADEDFISAVELNAMVAAGNMVETKTEGTNVTVSA